MTPETRQARLESYRRAHADLIAALAAIPPAFRQRRAASDPWTIHEIIIHITDSEANSYIRCRTALAQSGAPVLGYDEMGWATALNYADQDTAGALELFRLLRGQTYSLIRNLPDAAWTTHTMQHSANGLMTLDDWLAVYAAHVPAHIAQMQAIYAELQHDNG
ncbi:MAG: DinB family protein [Chloroflexota bacterium]|nr:DinB family protein [Chloroflexota bacterium]